MAAGQPLKRGRGREVLSGLSSAVIVAVAVAIAIFLRLFGVFGLLMGHGG